MEFTEEKVFEALEVDAPVQELEKQTEQDGAPGGRAPQGEKRALSGGGEGTDCHAGQSPARNDPAEGTEGVPAPQEQEPKGEEKPGEMPKEERKAQAAKRRRREQQQAIDAAVEQALQTERERAAEESKSFFATAGLKNTLTGAPITSMEEYTAWQREFAAAKLQQDLKAGKLTPEAIDTVVAQAPAIQRVEQLLRRQEEQDKQRQQEAMEAQVEQELQQIRRLDPAIETVEDLLRMPKGQEFYRYVKRNGLSFLDAFKLVNGEALEAKAAQAGREQALLNARGKEHLTATLAQGAGGATVPPDEMAMFRLMMPEATETEIQNYYNKHRKQEE